MKFLSRVRNNKVCSHSDNHNYNYSNSSYNGCRSSSSILKHSCSENTASTYLNDATETSAGQDDHMPPIRSINTMKVSFSQEAPMVFPAIPNDDHNDANRSDNLENDSMEVSTHWYTTAEIDQFRQSYRQAGQHFSTQLIYKHLYKAYTAYAQVTDMHDMHLIYTATVTATKNTRNKNKKRNKSNNDDDDNDAVGLEGFVLPEDRASRRLKHDKALVVWRNERSVVKDANKRLRKSCHAASRASRLYAIHIAQALSLSLEEEREEEKR